MCIRDRPQKEGDHVRIISGNVLTGTKTAADGFIGFYANQPVSYTHLRSRASASCALNAANCVSR